jgi:molybdopterin synthase catalytic subunit
MVRLREAAIDVDDLRRRVEHPACGAVLVFCGETRDTFAGRKVVRLEYEAWSEVALQEMQTIVDEIGARWPGARAAIEHRIGVVALGEVSVVIAVAAPHRAACYEASRHGIEALKSRVPIWKKEMYEDGAVWKANDGTPDRSADRG